MSSKSHYLLRLEVINDLCILNAFNEAHKL